MKTYDAIIRGFYAPLAAYLGRDLVQADTVAARPALPFASYKVLVPRIVQHGPESGHTEFDIGESSVTERKLTDIEATFSFNFYGRDDLEAMELAAKAEEYLDFVGEFALRDNGLTVVEVTNPQDRTLYLGDAYEYRVGFDVRFRVQEVKERTSPLIEEAEIEQI